MPRACLDRRQHLHRHHRPQFQQRLAQSTQLGEPRQSQSGKVKDEADSHRSPGPVALGHPWIARVACGPALRMRRLHSAAPGQKVEKPYYRRERPACQAPDLTRYGYRAAPRITRKGIEPEGALCRRYRTHCSRRTARLHAQAYTVSLQAMVHDGDSHFATPPGPAAGHTGFAGRAGRSRRLRQRVRTPHATTAVRRRKQRQARQRGGHWRQRFQIAAATSRSPPSRPPRGAGPSTPPR